jgi:carbamoyltransferase
VKILGISAFYHDSAAAIIEDGEIVAAAQEERFTRKKHDPGFPTNAVKFCLNYGGTSLEQLDAIAFYDKPLLKFERLLETYYAFAPKGLSSFITAMPVWLKEKMFLKRLLYEELEKIGTFDRKKVKLLFPEHHLSHAASAYYPSPFDDAAILTMALENGQPLPFVMEKERTSPSLKNLSFRIPLDSYIQLSPTSLVSRSTLASTNSWVSPLMALLEAMT